MRLLELAAAIAKGGKSSVANKKKNYLIAAIAQRTDGAIVISQNSQTKEPEPNAHAEVRVLKKADIGCTLYVARVLRDGTWAMAKPCNKCQTRIRNRGVKRVYYTIGPDEWGVWDVNKEKRP